MSDTSSVKHARNVVLVHGAYADGSSWSDSSRCCSGPG